MELLERINKFTFLSIKNKKVEGFFFKWYNFIWYFMKWAKIVQIVHIELSISEIILFEKKKLKLIKIYIKVYMRDS